MSKAIFVLDQMPECCEDCELLTHIYDSPDCIEFRCVLLGHVEDPGIFKFGNCPLKELPKKKATSAAAAIHLSYENNQNADLCLAYNIGFNDCLDTIIGQED